MSDRRRHPATCLDAERLAAFLDGRLDRAARSNAETHLAECGDCREALVELTRLSGELTDERERTTRPSWWMQPRFWYTTVGAVAAAVIAVVFVRPLFPGDAGRLDAAVGALASATATSRFTEGRLSGPFVWGPLPSVKRGADSGTASTDVELQARKLQALASTLPAPMAARASGLASLALGDVDGAIRALQAATDAGDAHADIDLSAAFVERWRRRGDRTDAQSAKAHAERAIARDGRDAAATFNLAVADEALGMKEEAVRAWTRYLALDVNSSWAAEARARIKVLAERRP